MTVWKRMLVFVVLACVVMAWIPVSASAVDPVSAAVTANAFAQAVAAYGAANGVSMSFDVTNADGIGEGVHELWESFLDDLAEDENENLEDYESLPVTIIYTLFKKSSGSGGNNNNDDDDKVAVAISAATAAAFDKFWNWLLSGPAEMEKVDNQYYEWTVDQNDNVSPIVVGDYQTYYIDGQQVGYIRDSLSWVNGSGNTWIINVPYPSFAYLKDYGSGVQVTLLATQSGGTAYAVFPSNTNYNSSQVYSTDVGNGWYQAWPLLTFGYGGVIESILPTYSSFITPSGSVNVSVSSTGDKISVLPYVYDPVIQPITIPNIDDPDYEPVPVEIPLNIPWDPATFGDGNQDQDSNQVTATAAAVGTAILAAPENAIELEPAADPSNPVTPPSEVYIPFLPVQLPSFNFSLSGIWHYVIDWVASIGVWFTTVFTIWSNLPYAIVLPVYASAVIVIVLGVYKRFFM